MDGRRWIAVLVLISLSTGCTTMIYEPSQEGTPWVEHRYIDALCYTENEQALQFYNEAVQLQSQGELEEAKHLYQKALKLDPDFCDAMDNLGAIYRHQGDNEKAIRYYQRSIKAFPENPVAHMNLGLAYELQGRFSDALAEYQLLIEIAPDNPEGYYGVGSVYMDMDQCDLALAQFEEAERIYLAEGSPWVDHARYSLGVCHYDLGNYVRCRDYLEQIYPSFEDSAEVNYHLGMCYLLSDIDADDLAARYLRRAEALGIQLPPEVSRQLDR